MHSHPVLITFCAIAYYKRLVEKKDELNSFDLIQLANRTGKKTIEPIDNDKIKAEEPVSSEQKKKKSYRKQVLNRWAVAVTLINNLNLVPLRKETSSFRKVRV